MICTSVMKKGLEQMYNFNCNNFNFNVYMLRTVLYLTLKLLARIDGCEHVHEIISHQAY